MTNGIGTHRSASGETRRFLGLNEDDAVEWAGAGGTKTCTPAEWTAWIRGEAEPGTSLAMGAHTRADGAKRILHVVMPDGSIHYSTPGVMTFAPCFCTADEHRAWMRGGKGEPT